MTDPIAFHIYTAETSSTQCVEGFMLCLGQIACIFRLIAVVSGNDELEDASDILNCFTDVVFCTLSTRLKWTGGMVNSGRHPVMMVPPVQQMSRIDQLVPPVIGHPRQPQQWQPPYGYACPPSIPGYSAAAPAYPLPPPGYPASASPVAAPGYFVLDAFHQFKIFLLLDIPLLFLRVTISDLDY
ncbi:hypothetical protein CRYUN_Cryun14cG0036700 [Craigia yunnanensis]